MSLDPDSAPQVSAEYVPEGPGGPHYHVKIGGDRFEINVRLSPAEARSLPGVRETPWLTGSLRAGACCGAAAFWSRDGDTLSLLVGHDDETWDAGFMLPAATLDDVLTAVAAERPAA